MIKLFKNARNVPDDVDSAGDVSPKSCKNKVETNVGWISDSSKYARSGSGAVQGPPARSVAVERAGELATMDLWDALASFAEGGGMPRGWAGVVGPTHPFVGVVDGGLTLNKTS
ncbi:hypothetical protein FOA52_007702 [Chlamydomonas sp. UWO 241]|nr:hypothetical protein FOA52_007702 [Chlamydomonas sp. UWO 241]